MTLIYFIIILSVTIFVHELGHFIFAKRAGIYVYEFCIGMGPRIFKFKRKNDETEYGIRILPIGGFCAMAGEDTLDDENVPKEKKLMNKTWSQRFMTMVAGVMFNFIFAIILLFIIGLINGNPNNKPAVASVPNDGPAYLAGLRVDDVIIKLNNVKINTIDRLMIEYQINYGKPIELEVLRDDEILRFTITPETIESDGGISYQYDFALDGSIEKGFFEAIEYAVTKFLSLIEQMFVTFAYLFTGKLSLSNLSGPVGIYNIVGQSAQAGILSLISLTSLLSINVGFINLLPIPAFDGGRILFLIIEKIRRKPVKPEIENRIHAVGLILLMILMIVVTYNDIVRFIIK